MSGLIGSPPSPWPLENIKTLLFSVVWPWPSSCLYLFAPSVWETRSPVQTQIMDLETWSATKATFLKAVLQDPVSGRQAQPLMSPPPGYSKQVIPSARSPSPLAEYFGVHNLLQRHLRFIISYWVILKVGCGLFSCLHLPLSLCDRKAFLGHVLSDMPTIFTHFLLSS